MSNIQYGSGYDSVERISKVGVYYWDTGSLAWVKAAQSAGGGASSDVNVTNISLAVSGPLTDIQLRAVAVPVSVATLPLPSGAATEGGNLATLVAKDFATQATLAAIKAKTDNLDTALSTRTKPADSQHVTLDDASIAVTGTFFQATQPVSAVALPLPTGAAKESGGNLDSLVAKDFATNANQGTGNASLATIAAKDYLTDTQLRAAPVTITGDIAVAADAATGERDVRRLFIDERQLLETQLQSLQLILLDERYSADRRGFEVR